MVPEGPRGPGDDSEVIIPHPAQDHAIQGNVARLWWRWSGAGAGRGELLQIAPDANQQKESG